MKNTHEFEWVKYATRVITEEGKNRFKSFITNVDWEALMIHSDCPHENTELMQNKLDTLNNICFPWKTRKIRSTDKPWIDDNIRRKIRRRRRCYWRKGRSQRWDKLKADSDNAIRRNKRKYYEKECEKLTKDGPRTIPYKALQNIQDSEMPRKWSINHLDPKATDEDLSEDLADFFVKISDEFSPLNKGNLPRTYDSPFQVVFPHEVSQRMKSAKKTLSAITGDALPCMVSVCADILAIPSTRIINMCLQSKEWPTQWKTEIQTPIPKKTNPASYDDLRNISCTNFASKIMESFVLDKLRSEVKINRNQFGGIKRSGTNHFLADMYKRIIECLEDGRSAVSILSVDFSKAFNRMCINGHAANGRRIPQ